MRRAALVVLPLFLAACADDPSSPGTGPQEAEGSATAGEMISGVVRGPSGSAICDYFPAGTAIRVSIYDVSTELATVAGGQTLTCPAIEYSIPVAAGSYIAMARMQGPDNQLDPAVAKVWVDTTLITVPLGGAVTNNIIIGRGQLVTGDATQDGGPFAGDILSPRVNAGGSSIFLTTLNTTSDGSWTLYDQPVYLQRGIEVTYECGLPLGRRATGVNAGAFRFAQTRRAIDCSYASGSVAGSVWSHRSNALWLTAWPGFFDTHSTVREWNAGWGVQFPVGPEGGSGLYAANLLYHGGLVISTGSDILSGANLGGYGMECGAECFYDFADMTVDVAANPDGTRRVNFTYTAPAANLWIRQSSWDGHGEYTLFRYVIRNDGDAAVTLNPGLFMDWDIGNSVANSVVTERQRRLMYTTDGDRLMGTLIIDRAAAGNYARVNAMATPSMTLADQIAAMNGSLTAPSAGPADMHYFHSAAASTLEPGRYTTLWVAVVAGRSITELRINANNAEIQVEEVEAMMTPARVLAVEPSAEALAPMPASFAGWHKATIYPL